MSELGETTVQWTGSKEIDAPLVLLLHGWGETEANMTALVPRLPIGPTYASVRAPYLRGDHYNWFAPGRSFDTTLRWFLSWLEIIAPHDRRVVLVGFSAGAAFVGGALLANPDRYSGVAILYGTLPFDAGVSTPPGGLSGARVFLAHSTNDPMIQRDLLARAWKYLTEDSGAIVQATRYEGGHGVSSKALVDLARWITEVTAA